MAPDPHTELRDDDAEELITIVTELLSEAGELACPSVSGFLEYMIDRLPDQSTGSLS